MNLRRWDRWFGGMKKTDLSWFQYADYTGTLAWVQAATWGGYYCDLNQKLTDLYDPSTLANRQYVDKYNSYAKLYNQWLVEKWLVKATLMPSNVYPTASNQQWRLLQYVYFDTTSGPTTLTTQLALITSTISLEDVLRCIPTMRFKQVYLINNGEKVQKFNVSSRGSPWWFVGDSKRDFQLDLSAAGGLNLRGAYGSAASPAHVIYMHTGLIWTDSAVVPLTAVPVTVKMAMKVKSWDPIVKVYDSV